MNNIFKCPFGFYQQEHSFQLQGLTNYISHLRKCIQVRCYVQENLDEFYLCPYCLQIFLSQKDALEHRNDCKQINICCLVSDDRKWVIKLGEERDLNSIEKLFDDQIKTQPKKDEQAKIPYYQQMLPFARFHQKPAQQQECMIIEKKDHFSFKLYERDSSLTSMVHKFFNNFNNKPPINCQFKHRITTEILKTAIFGRYDIPFTKEIFINNKVLEFVEDVQGEIEEEFDDKIYYSVITDSNKNDVLWILANEWNQFFRQCLVDHPWGVFRFQTNRNFKIEQDELEQNQPMSEILYNNFVQAQAELKLHLLRQDLIKSRESNLSLKEQNELILSQIQYEDSLTVLLNKRNRELFQEFSNKKTQNIMNENLKNNIQNDILIKYNCEIERIDQKLYQYLDDKKRDCKLEVSQLYQSSIQTIVQQLYKLQKQKLTPQIEELKKEEKSLIDRNNQIQKQFNQEKERLTLNKRYKKQPNVQKKVQTHMNQVECLRCKTGPRNTIIKPCGHCLFCESCMIEIIQNQERCPLSAIKMCWNKENITKYKKFNIVK